VEIQAVPFGDLLTTIRAQAGGGAAPTIAGIYDLWLPELVRDEIVVPAPDEVATDVSANWPEGVVTAATVDEALYGVPNEIDLYALNYNTRLFEEAGIDAPPTTWDELVTAAEALTVRDGDTIVQQGFGLINSWAAGVVHPFASLLASNGGALIDADGMPALNTPEAVETFELYENLVSGVGVTDPTMGTADANTQGPFLDNFVSGNTAMIIMANWWQGSLRDAMGDAFADVATAPIPVGPNGDGPRPVSYEWLTIVNGNATPEQQDAAWRFLQFLHGPESGTTGTGMGEILIGMGIIPSRTSDQEAFADQLSDPFLQTDVDSLADAVPFPMILGGQELTEMVQGKLEGIEFGDLTAAEAATQAQAEATEILSQFYE
jgi:ABC-type glycerol-3-phosphate transport system substrate-binding protein